MKSLVKSSEPRAPTGKAALKAPVSKAASKFHDYSPDDLLIVQKRQDWRLRVALICLDHFELLEQGGLLEGRGSFEDRLTVRYARISDYVKRELPSLLASGVAVHELEALRYQANYFLEELVRLVRMHLQNRAKTKKPLEEASAEEVEREVKALLEEQTDSLCVFVEELVKLGEFELEVGNQRERIRLLLGGDRRLSGLGNNETIMSAPLGQLWRALDDFVSIHAYLRENLPPLLDKSSPYRALEEELKVANEQLQRVLRDRVVPFERHLGHKRAQDRFLEELESALEDSFHQAESILEIRIGPLVKQAKSPREGLILSSELDSLFVEVERLLELVAELPSEISLPPLPAERGEARDAGLEGLESLLKAVAAAAPPIRETIFMRRGKGGEVPEQARFVEMLSELGARLGELRSKLSPGAPEARAIRERKLRPLREHLCALVGELRTFLQTGFAHIASKDPRSTESSYHFFLREFSDESRQAILLLKEIRSLEAYINNLLRIHVAGLTLTPENLARILRVLFIDKDEEKKRIPSGEGWRVMSAFLRKLRDELVPRLQKVCALDGIRYEDKNFLSEWAMDLAHNCTLCLTQHEIGYNLIQEMGRLRDDDDTMTTHQSHTHIVVTKTCNAMQKSLTEICMTLTASIPYVGIMRGGVERRASVFFHRQQKILESGEVPAEEQKSVEEEAEQVWV